MDQNLYVVIHEVDERDSYLILTVMDGDTEVAHEIQHELSKYYPYAEIDIETQAPKKHLIDYDEHWHEDMNALIGIAIRRVNRRR